MRGRTAIRQRCGPDRLGRLLVMFAALLLAIPVVQAEVPGAGAVVRGQLDFAGKQVVLPDGDWVVAGHGYD
jgi:hypothetical protein